MRVPILMAILFTAVLAGCAESAPAPEPAKEPAKETRPADQFNVTAVEAGRPATPSPRDFLFAVDQDAPVAGFAMQMPKNVSYKPFESFSFEYVDLVFSPVYGEAPEGLALLVYDLENGELVYGRAMFPTRGTAYLTAALPSEFDEPAQLSSWASTWSGDVQGMGLGVVVAARGATGPVGIAMHVADEHIDPFDLPEGMDVLEDVPTTPAAIGTGQAVDVQAYLEVHFGLFGTPGLIGVDATIGEPTVQEDLPTFVKPHGGARDATVVAGGTIDAGWSYASTAYLAGEGATEWAHHVAAGQHTADDEGYMVYGNGYGFLGSALAFGLPIGAAQGDGDATPAARLELTSVTDNEFYVLLAQTISLDPGLDALLGIDAPGDATLFEGLLLPDLDSGTLRLEAGDAILEFAGAVPADPAA